MSTDAIGDDAVRCTLFPSDGAGLLTEVSQHIQSAKWTVDEFGVETGRLEDVFRSITIGDPDKAGEKEAVT